MRVDPEHPGRRRWRRWGYVLAFAVFLTAITALLLPWGASAFYLRRAGEQLEAKSLTAAECQAAEHALARALVWFPANPQAYRLLAQAHARQGDWVAAANALAHYVTLKPKNPLGFWELSAACEQVSAPELGQVFGHRCGTTEENQPEALVRLWEGAGQSVADFVRAGDEYRRAQDWSQSISFYERALMLDPDSAMAWYGLGVLYQARNESEAALQSYARAVALEPEPSVMAQAHNRSGQILATAEQWSTACAEFAQAVALMPKQGPFHLSLGWCLYKEGKHLQQADAELRLAAGLVPDNPWPYLWLAELDFAEKDHAGMLAHTQQAADADPTLYLVWVSKGRALRELGRLSEAEEAHRHAVEIAPDKADSHISLGQVLERLERLDEAIEEYRQAVSIAPDDVTPLLKLGGAYHASGQTQLSATTYQHVLALDPDNATARQALRDLKH